MKKKYLITQLIVVVTAITFFACQKDVPQDYSLIQERIDQYGQYDINAFLLDRISKNRIVMLGDHEHGQGLYYRVVINFFKFWLDEIEQNRVEDIPKKIALFLEHDSLTNQRLYRFFHTGNVMDLIEPEDFAGPFTVDKIEFVNDLCEIHNHVKWLRNSNALQNKIQFQIIGPEKILNADEKFPEKQDYIAREERDQYVAEQVCQYLNTHPDYHAFIFYGAAHLFRSHWPKSSPPYYSNSLAYHLTERYKNAGGCYVFFQYNLKTKLPLPQVFYGFKRSYAIENRYLSDFKFNIPHFPYDSDASFFLNDFFENAVHIGQVPTKNFVELMLHCLPVYIENPVELGNEAVIRAAVLYLQMVSGYPRTQIDLKDLDSINDLLTEWKMWHFQVGFDPVLWTTDYQFLLKPFNVYRQLSDEQNRYKFELGLKKFLGTAPDTLAHNPDEQIRIWLRHLERNKVPVLVPRLIQIMWVGTDEERESACKDLQNLTGEIFKSAKEWATWWRRKVELVERLEQRK